MVIKVPSNFFTFHDSVIILPSCLQVHLHTVLFSFSSGYCDGRMEMSSGFLLKIDFHCVRF